MKVMKYKEIFRTHEFGGYAKLFNQKVVQVQVQKPQDIRVSEMQPGTAAKVMRIGDMLKGGQKKDKKKNAPHKNSRSYEEVRQETKEEAIKRHMDELDQMVGLESVKKDVKSVINLVRVNQMRAEKGLKNTNMSLHLVFTGNPGTGKTTVARLIGSIYKEIGILSQGHFIEADRGSLVAGYVGQTALKVKEVVESARGGILFIDEAYALYRAEDERDFGIEAIDTLLKLMEDHREDLIVIVAGYDEPMGRFLKSNPGLQSRFNKYVRFSDYSSEELSEIFVSICKQNHYTLSTSAKLLIDRILSSLVCQKKDNFSNGRMVRNVFEKVIVYQSNRVIQIDNITKGQLQEITHEDILAFLETEKLSELH